MIEIILKGDSAQAYIDNENITERRLVEVTAEYKVLQVEHDELITEHLKLQQRNIPSARVLHDTEQAEGLRPSFAKKAQEHHSFPNTEVIPSVRTNKRWTPNEVSVIYAALRLPDTNKDRTIEVLAGKLDRTEAAVATKIHELGLCIKNHRVAYKD